MISFHIRKPFYAGRNNPFGWKEGTWGVGLARSVLAVKDEVEVSVSVPEIKGRYRIESEKANQVGKQMFTKKGKVVFVVPLGSFEKV